MYGDWTAAVPNGGSFADCSDCWISLFTSDIGTQEIYVLTVKWEWPLLGDGGSEVGFPEILVVNGPLHRLTGTVTLG